MEIQVTLQLPLSSSEDTQMSEEEENSVVRLN